MEILLILAGLAVLATPLAVIYLLVSHSRIIRRLAAAEARLAGLAAYGVPTEAPGPRPAPLSSAPPEPLTPSIAEPGEATEPVAEEVGSDVAPLPVAPPPPPAPPSPPRSVVLNQDRLDALFAWLTKNWFYVVSAVSLALAGIFLVQYSIEKGLLPPWARVTAALFFGAALIGAGEYIRRRFGDDEDSSTAYLPSTFSSAGIVTLFGGILAARTLYGLIGAEIALIGLAAVGAVALVLGWFYGPLLAAIGLIGATAAPFVVGGSSEDPSWLLIYFAIVTLVGLAIDTVQRWAWVSALSLVLGFAAATLLVLGTAGQGTGILPFFVIYCGLVALAATAIPVRSLLSPDHGGSLISVSILARDKEDGWPEFPTNLAAGALAVASALIVFAAYDSMRSDVFWTALLVLAGLVALMLIWARNATALTDQIAIPAIAFVAVIPSGERIWDAAARIAAEPEADRPLMVTTVVVMAIALSVLAAWRSLKRVAGSKFVAAGAALMAPAVAIAIEVTWAPKEALGTVFWALHALAIAAVMVGMAERFARADGAGDRLRTSLAALSALASIAFAVVILFSSAALTVALAVTVLAAAWLDRRFNLPLMGAYVLVGVVTTGFRLVVDPGLDWGLDAPTAEVLLAYGGAVISFGLAWWLLRAVDRPRTRIILESAVFSASGLLLSLLLRRGIDAAVGFDGVASHWHAGIGATIWTVLALTQLRRLSIGGPLAIVRKVLAGALSVPAVIYLGLAVAVFNPLFGGEEVFGVPILNTLIPGYALPALALLFGAKWLSEMPVVARQSLQIAGLALLGLWLTLAIRHVWQGGDAMAIDQGIGQPELYSYTLALLLIGAGLFYQSLARGSALLRRLGLLFIGLAVAKVFFVDIAGLGGLIRVFSLLFLGLALAGLAWLNRWAETRTAPQEDSD